MAIGPGVLAVGFVLAVLLLLAVIGLVSGGGDGGKKAASKGGKSAKRKKHPARKRERAATPAPAAVPKNVKIRIVPAEATYVCVDDGRGGKLFEGTITATRSFQDKHVRVNIGRPSAKIYVNGKQFRYREGPEAVGFSFSRTGRARSLPLGDRPCA
jgi:hypothetical protein